MHALIPLLTLAVGASAAPAKTAEFRDPAATFSVQAPVDWPRQDNAEQKTPIVLFEFVGSEKPQDEGQILGAVLKIVRMSRKDTPPKALAPTDALFEKSAGAVIAGRPARTFSREYEHTTDPMMHGGEKFLMRTEGFVVRTEDAYYIVEFRAERKQYAKYKWALERARVSFRLL